jgi:CHASE2 domain/CHAT domain
MSKNNIFKLRVRKITSICNFELSWGNGLVIDVNVNYPFSLTQSYENWHRAYLDYYVRLRVRGKKGISGTGSTPRDFHQQLVETEAKLLSEFQQWLLSPELVSINRTITKAVSQTSEKQPVDIFLTCTPIEIAKLPWESWDIYFDTDSDSPEKIRIARSPANISNEVIHPVRRKIRVLAILGDDTGLDLEDDKQAVKSLNSIVDVKFTGWNKNTDTTNFDANALKHQIIKAIADERGWDILFFAGHSNETQLTGGELGIAPGVALSMQEIEGSLKIARKRGLQFAIFNSCNGINIAEFLINLGLSQVAVMREPIHDQVAQIFLVKFLQSLAEYKDVHTAFLDASQLLKEDEKRLSYPSAYLVPSLFRHAEAELFQIQPFDITSRIKRWLPTKLEAKWLAGLLLLSLLPAVQNLLLEPRILVQAIYREITPIKPVIKQAPVLLVKIDDYSLKEAQKQKPIQKFYPLDYSYLTQLITTLSNKNAQLIGIDYILSEIENQTQPNNISNLKDAIRNGVAKKTWFLFGYDKQEKDKTENQVSYQIAGLDWSIHGDINFFNWYVELPEINQKYSDDSPVPFSYMLSLTYLWQNSSLSHFKDSQSSQQNVNTKKELLTFVNTPNNTKSEQAFFIKNLRLQPISNFTGWFHPIIDFSIDPEQAYKSISACKLLGSCGSEEIKNLDEYIVIIAPGGYSKAGLTGNGEDNTENPWAIAYWRKELSFEKKFSKGEGHAYMVHHLLNKHLVIPVPDFLMILSAALLAKCVSLYLFDNPQNRKLVIKVVSANTIIYFLTSLQLYMSGYILFPVFLPAIIFWKYIHFTLRRLSK